MAGGLGMLGFIGLAKESSGDVPVAAEAYIEALSESIVLEFERIETTNLAGTITEPDDYLGAARVSGDIVMAADPITLGHFLRCAIGDPVTTQVVTGDLYSHSFKPTNVSHWDGRFAQQPLTVEVFRDVGSAQQYTGVNVNNLTLSAAFNQDLRLTASILGVGATDIAKGTPSFVGSPVDPFGFDTASLSIAGAANTDVESFTMSFANNLETVGTLANKRFPHKIRRAGFMQPRFEMVVSFEDLTNLNRFRNQTEVAMALHFARANSFGLTIDIPRAIYTAFPTGVGGRGRQTATITGMMRYHAGSGTALEMKLQTTQSAY